MQTVSSLVAGFTTPVRANLLPNDKSPNAVNTIANWQLSIDGQDKSSLITTISFSGTPSANGLYEATLTLSTPDPHRQRDAPRKDTIQDLNGNALDGDANGGFGGDFVRSFTVANVGPIGNVTIANTTTSGTQSASGIDANASGASVIVWQESRATPPRMSSRQYDANGVAGPVIAVTGGMAENRPCRAVAMNDDGSFVVVWRTSTSADIWAAR